MPGRPYTLVASTGLSPQVVTEMVQALADPRLGAVREPRYPREVHVITTGTGRDFIDALFFGVPRTFRTNRGELHDIEPCGAHWAGFCASVLGALPEPPPVEVHVAKDAKGRPVDDIRDAYDDESFADTCFEVVAGLAEPDDRLDVIGVIAGGRKNMSGHLQNAFSVWARPGDDLYHVVVSPPAFERTDFFYRDASDPAHAAVELRPIRVSFPRLYPVIKEPVLDRLGTDPQTQTAVRTQRAILDHLDRYLVAETPPAFAFLTPVDGKTELTFSDAGGLPMPDATVTLDPADAATLLVLVETTRNGAGPVARDALLTGRAQRLRQRAYAAVGGVDGYTPWAQPIEEARTGGPLSEAELAGGEWESSAVLTEAVKRARTDASKSVSALRRSLDEAPFTAKWLALPRMKAGRFQWDVPLPRFGVRPPFEVSPWPFEQIEHL